MRFEYGQYTAFAWEKLALNHFVEGHGSRVTGHGLRFGSFCGLPGLEVLEQICRVTRLRHVPAQTHRKFLHDGSRVRARLTQGFQGGCAIAFGKAFTPVICHQWHVTVRGQARAELFVQKDLPWRARDQVLAA
jgi:hypothetical protein